MTELGLENPKTRGNTLIDRLRQLVFEAIEDGPLDSPVRVVVEFVLVGLIVANVVAVALETVPSLNARFGNLFNAFEQGSIVIYTAEYVLRLWSAIEDPRIAAMGRWRGRLAFAMRPLMLVDLVAFVPSYLGFVFTVDLRLLRIFRIFRLLKLARYSQALQALLGVFYAERSALFASMILLLATVCVGGEIMYLTEGSLQPDKLGTMPSAMYWAIATLTTVGYGDITPITPLGKLVAGLVMVVGLGLFALPIGIISNGFVDGLSRRRFAITWTMLRSQPLFIGLDMSALDDVLEAATALIVREHRQLSLAGSDATTFYVIVSGTALVESPAGVREIGAGATLGSEALEHGGTYSESAVARSDVRVIAVPGEELRWLARKYPVLAERIAGSADAAVVESASRLKDLEAENAKLRRLVSDLMLERMSRAESQPAE